MCNTDCGKVTGGEYTQLGPIKQLVWRRLDVRLMNLVSRRLDVRYVDQTRKEDRRERKQLQQCWVNRLLIG
jgi:hypothetical protein